MKTSILSHLFILMVLNVFSQHAPDAFLGECQMSIVWAAMRK